MTKPLDAIFFDIDDTLFSPSVFADKARRAAVDAMLRVGLRTTREACVKELSEVISEFSSNYGGHFNKLLDRLPPEASMRLHHEVVVAAGVVAYHETKWQELKVYDDVYEVLRWISERVRIRGIISAGLGIKQAEKVMRLRILEFLTPSAIYFTEQVGINKPNPKLYRRVLKEQGLQPERVMYVGDNPSSPSRSGLTSAVPSSPPACRVRSSGRRSHRRRSAPRSGSPCRRRGRATSPARSPSPGP